MKYCVVKNTVRVIDGSNNSVELMLQNAAFAGFPDYEVEILTEIEYKERKGVESDQPKESTDIEKLKEELATIQGALDFIIMNY